MSIRRRSTVHDLASLRLHPDGSRVQAAASSGSKSKSSATANATTKTTRLAGNTGLNTKAELVALDAGGTASIKQRRRFKPTKFKKVDRKGKGKAEEYAEQDEGEGGHNVDTRQRREDSSASGEGLIQSDSEDSVKDPRAKKRRKFYQDFSFLDVLHISAPGPLDNAQASSSGTVHAYHHTGGMELMGSQTFLPVPSSDLLKCIHYFASEYYTSRNCLFDAPKQARNARKAREVIKLAQAVSKNHSQYITEEDGIERDSEDEHGDSVVVEPKAKTGSPKVIKRKPRRDMYKAFDGSALIAIGMLLQEHVVGMMSTEPSDDWLRQMEAREALEANGFRGTRRKMKDEDDEGDVAGGSVALVQEASQSIGESGVSVTSDSTDDSSSEDSSSHVSSENE